MIIFYFILMHNNLQEPATVYFVYCVHALPVTGHSY